MARVQSADLQSYTMWWLSVSLQLEDKLGQATAQMNVSDLRKVLGLPGGEESSMPESEESRTARAHRVRRQSMEQLDLIKVDPHVCFFILFYVFSPLLLFTPFYEQYSCLFITDYFFFYNLVHH